MVALQNVLVLEAMIHTCSNVLRCERAVVIHRQV
jgi:hypothetical protein